ncbi:NADH dehydrogenase [ubiquinone] 1 alpha subcomplex subunit 4-like 2 isoform 1-T1 [Ara ararauna]
MKGPLLGAMFSRHVKRHPGALITQKVSAADVTQADSYTVYRSPATGLLCHISPVNLPLIPLIGFISVGMGSAILYLLRLALYSPDVRYGSGCPWGAQGSWMGYDTLHGKQSCVQHCLEGSTWEVGDQGPSILLLWPGERCGEVMGQDDEADKGNM